MALWAACLHGRRAKNSHSTCAHCGNCTDWYLLIALRSLAMTYGLILKCNRDSTDRELIKDLRKLALRTHHACGGSTKDQQRFNDARTAWANALQEKTSAATASPAVARFVLFVRQHVRAWRVKHWCATLEKRQAHSYEISRRVHLHSKCSRHDQAFLKYRICLSLPRAPQSWS